MNLKVSELAELSGITVRTLQYYDKIGLLQPKKDPGNGYRIYSEEEIDRLQEVLLFKQLDIPLKTILDLLDASDYERLDALKLHRSLIDKRLEDLKLLYQNIDQSINEMEEGIKMSKEDKFKGMDFNHNPYEEEARQKWGAEKVDGANARIKDRSDEQRQDLQTVMTGIFQSFAEIRQSDPTSDAAVILSERFHRLLNAEIGNFYTKEVFKELGQMYIDDERFTKNLDNWGDGTARFMRNAMVNYSDNYL